MRMEYSARSLPAWRTVLITLLLSGATVALADVPTIPTAPDLDIPTPSFSCVSYRDPDFGDCWGTIQMTIRNGAVTRSDVRLRVARRRASRTVRKISRLARRASNNGDSESYQQYLSAKSTWRDSIKPALSTCYSYYEEQCASVDPGPEDPGELAQACTDIGSSLLQSSSGDISTRIVNGAVCSRGSTPWVPIFNNGSQWCSGTMVASNLVLTAGHCLEGVNCSNLTVSDGNGGFATASQCLQHPSYSFPDYDIGLIRLNSSLNTAIATVHTTADLSNGETLLIAGYGRNENEVGKNIADSALLAGYVPISSVDNQNIYTQYSYSDKSMSNSCNGDSGGGAAVKRGSSWVLVGVVSGGSAENCGMTEGSDTSYWTNLTAHWAQNWLAANSSGVVD